MIQTGFQFRRAGTAAAMAVVMLLIVAGLYFLSQILAKRFNNRVPEAQNG